MQSRKILLRITKLLGKSFLGLLLALFLAVVLVHLPVVQKKITRSLSSYLSSKIKAKVDIEQISFSILGNIAITDVVVWDQNTEKILSVQKIEVSTSIVKVLSGDFIFDKILIAGAEVKLVQSKNGLNIQYIIDAFRPQKEVASEKSKALNLQFNTIIVENVLFEFVSTTNGTSVEVNLGSFESKDALISTQPTKIKANQVYLQQTIVDILSAPPANTATVNVSNDIKLRPDFDTGIIFEVNTIDLKNNAISFNVNHVKEAKKFDPSHISLKDIQLNISDLLIREDTLAASLQSITAQLPGFTLTEGSAGIKMNRDKVFLSDIRLASGGSEFQADLISPINFNSSGIGFQLPIEIAVNSQILPNDISYFLPELLYKYIGQWKSTELALEFSYGTTTGKIKVLKLKTGSSEAHLNGHVTDLFDLKKLSWSDIEVNASIGPDFAKIVGQLLHTTKIPPHSKLTIMSSGDLNKVSINGKVQTSWGNVSSIGYLAKREQAMKIDLNVIGEDVNIGQWVNPSWLGAANLKGHVAGIIGKGQYFQVEGLINDVEINDQTIHRVSFQGNIREDSAVMTIAIEDPDYRSKISSEISLSAPLKFKNHIQLDSFKLGSLLHRDSTLIISGDTKSSLVIEPSSLSGRMEGNRLAFHRQSFSYTLDTLSIKALISPIKSELTYNTNSANASLTSNFDIRSYEDLIQILSKGLLLHADSRVYQGRSRTASLSVALENANFLKLFGIDIDEFGSLSITGNLDEQKEIISLQATSGKFKGLGISLDTLQTTFLLEKNEVAGNMNIKNLLYDSIRVGNLDLDLASKGNALKTTFFLSKDTMDLLGLELKLLPSDSGVLVYPIQLMAFNTNYSLASSNTIFVDRHNLKFNNFQVSRSTMKININGDLNAFDASINNVDLTALNFLLSSDTTIISQGNLSANLSYSRNKDLDLKADIDNLVLYNSSPLTLSATAVREGNQVPFALLLSNVSNTMGLEGRYFLTNDEVDASFLLEIKNMELFDFLTSRFVDKMNGTIKGRATVKGPIKKPSINGSLQFLDLGLTTFNPTLSFQVKNDSIVLDNSSLHFNHFTIYDKENNPLSINGNIRSDDYQTLAYDLQINTDRYNVINNADSTRGKLRSQLVMGSHIKLTGEGKDAKIDAKVTIKDDTDLAIVVANDDVELLKSDGIVDFVDPSLVLNSNALQVGSLYDSLLATLPDFNLSSKIVVEKNAALRILLGEQSGDYMEASGGANLDLSYDRTGNINLAGNYTIEKGIYRLSFYDLVKKNFNLVAGSTINWSGAPKNGDLAIKATHTVETNSLGLIGHEIGENEKSVYKRSLDYEVGISINGTLDKPIISFSLDLPQKEIANYPVLANKLDRLRQPEYASELNKQVFGLLVLGGFLPQSNADVNSSVIATTALSNSVNSLLASQLNRFANQYVKGVNIDVGIQSFSDYSAPGGKTQTAMDFRVSKKVMNDRLSFEIGGDFDINQSQSGANSGNNYRGDFAIIYDLTGNGDKQLKLFNNETYDIIYQEIRNTGISLIFIRELDRKEKNRKGNKNR